MDGGMDEGNEGWYVCEEELVPIFNGTAMPESVASEVGKSKQSSIPSLPRESPFP